MKYKNYIFDLYGTLVDIHTNENKKILWVKAAEFLKCYGIDYNWRDLKKSYRNKVKDLENRMDNSYGEIRLEDVFYDLMKEKGKKPSEELMLAFANLFRVLSREYLCLYPQVIEMLETLKKEHKKIYLLSNAQRVFTMPEMEQLGLLPYFDGIFLSSDRGCKKPQGSFMNALLKEYGLKPQDSIMIGNDETTDIAIASEAGIASIYIHSNLSPEPSVQLNANYKIMDGCIMKILEI